MSIEPRLPPPQLAAKLQRAFGGRAGWGGFVLQILFVAALVWICYEIVANARANLQAQRITAGFGFLANTAGFDVSQNLIPYSGSDPYTRVFLVGLLNALLAALPNPRQSIDLFGSFFLSNRGFVIPKPIGNPGFEPFVLAIVIAIVGSLLLRRYARKQLFDHGRMIRIWPYVLGMLIGLPLLSSLVFGAPVKFEIPELKG